MNVNVLRRTGPARLATIGAVVIALGLGTAACSSGPSTGNALVVTVKPVHGDDSTAYHDGELLNIRVGSNKMFKKFLKVNILECSDPGGSVAHLPKSVANCDGNTIQGSTVLINPNGGFSLKDYPVYSLPNHVLGEQANQQPICDLTHKCVLYVGENQENFTSPKLFSAPFTVASTEK